MDPEDPQTDDLDSDLEIDEIEPEQELLESVLERKDDEPAIQDKAQLARLDPVRKYLLEISEFEPLTTEEEHRLAILYREEGNQEAAYKLVTSNLKLVVRIAYLYSRVYHNIMDLIQEGNIGLMEAVKRFDPYMGTRLPTYATWWVKAYIIKFILDNFRIVRVGTTNERRKLLFNLKKEKEKLRLQGIEPTAALIAERLNVSPEEVRAVEGTIEATDLSLDSYVDDEESTRYIDRLHATEELIDERLARGELRDLFQQQMREFSESLNERERAILQERLIAEEPKTLQELAERFGVTREAIRLNEKTLINKIKVHMKEAFKNVTDVEFSLMS